MKPNCGKQCGEGLMLLAKSWIPMICTTFLSILTCMTLASYGFYNMAFSHELLCPCMETRDRIPRETAFTDSDREVEKNDGMIPESNGGKSIPCCGFCSCSERCLELGNCCLSVYKNLQEGRDTLANTRFSCVNLLTRNVVNIKSEVYYDESQWLVTKCAPQNHDQKLRELCESPEGDGSFESVIPVQHSVSRIGYSNRYCAACNGIHEYSLRETWKVEVYCETKVSLSTRNLLTTFQRKKCDMVLKAPQEAYQYRCLLPSYTISECNKTGKWPHYNKDVDLACQSFIDPFNFTYKNYFCYICNNDNEMHSSNWQCSKPDQTLPDAEQAFQLTLDLDTIRYAEAESVLKCNSNSQFLDYKKIVCRNIFCSMGQRLTAGKCSEGEAEIKKTCTRIGVYFKISSELPEESLLLSDLQIDFYFDYFEKEVIKRLTNKTEIVKEFYVFIDKTSALFVDTPVEVLVVYLVFDVAAKNLSAFADHLQRQQSLYLSYPNDTSSVRFNLDIDQFDMNVLTIEPLDVEIRVMRHGRALSIFSLFRHKRYGQTSCQQTDTMLVNKLLSCPFIKVDIKHLPLKIQDGVLETEENFPIQIVLSSWQYRRHGNEIHLCLEDYKKLFKFIPMPMDVTVLKSVGTTDQSETVAVSILVLLVFAPT